MSGETSRRKFLLAATAVSLSPLAHAQSAPNPPDMADADVPAKFPDEAGKHLKDAIENNANNGVNRLKHPLPEGSEPYFNFIASRREVRNR